MLLSFSTICTVYVAHSVSAVLLFCFFRWWIVLERLNENEAAAAVVVLYCCCDTKENKRRQEKKSSEKTEQMERKQCCCGLINISVREFLTPGCKEVMVQLCTYISTYRHTFKPFSDMNGISFVTVALKTSSCHKWDKIVP